MFLFLMTASIFFCCLKPLIVTRFIYFSRFCEWDILFGGFITHGDALMRKGVESLGRGGGLKEDTFPS